MKKLLSSIIILATLLTILIGCVKENDTDGSGGGFVIPEGMNGNDVIKLLLANQRLDSKLLKNDGDIFEGGVRDMKTLASRAVANLPKASPLSTVIEGERGGKVEIDGSTFKWSDFKENCNSYDYFENITGNIVFSAELGADLIDNTKKHVQVVDKWVMVEGDKYYLHVEKNSETIYSMRSGQLEMCKRHKRQNGETVYELYISNDLAETRMLYVPGIRYEWSEKFRDGQAQYFVADNSKGFWETVIVGKSYDNYNVSCLVLKNDICYGAFYNPYVQSVQLLQAMSSDRATDILSFSDSEDSAGITLHFGGFDGIGSVEISTTPDKISSSAHDTNGKTVIYDTSDKNEIWAVPTGEESPILRLTNGNVITSYTEHPNGKVKINNITVGYGIGIYTGSLDITVYGETDSERFSSLKEFLAEAGLRCRRDIDTVLGGIRRAYVELDALISYYKWNSNKIATEDTLAAAITAEDIKFADMFSMYDAIKNAEVIDFSDKEAVALSINFAQITEINIASAKFENMSITVEGIELTVNDTTLYVENEEYTVGFALVSTSNTGDGLIHMTFTNDTKIVYTDTDTFTTGSANASVTIPVLSPGNYTVVAYISTADSIRASQYVPLTFTEIDTKQIDLGSTVLVPSQNEKGEIVLTYVENIDVNISLTSPDELDYVSLRDLLAEEAYKYGVASDAPVEKQDAESGNFSALTGGESSIESGTYRLAYSVENGDVTLDGYIYANYTALNAK